MHTTVRTLRAKEKVGRVFDLLNSCSHHGFPVVDNPEANVRVGNSLAHSALIKAGKDAPSIAAQRCGNDAVWAATRDDRPLPAHHNAPVPGQSPIYLRVELGRV